MSNFNTLLINPTYMKTYTVIDDNVDESILSKFIFEAQNLNLQQTIGQNLYEKLINDAPNWTGEYLTLVNKFIKPCVNAWAFYHSIEHINYKFTNKSVTKNSSEYGEASQLDEVKYLKHLARDKAEFYSETIKRYICSKQQSVFPEYFKWFPHELKANKSNYSSGIYTSGYKHRHIAKNMIPWGNIDPYELLYL